jgi:hypothetical protein
MVWLAAAVKEGAMLDRLAGFFGGRRVFKGRIFMLELRSR